MAGNVRVCQNCHGRGQVTVWDKGAQTYKVITCPACKGRGRVNIGTI